ncbi:MAG: DNA gyrase C-terminal beta-propeller domain-containing protein, partial [Pseudomonadota bacterium]
GKGVRLQKFKDGDGPRFAFHAQTTDRLLAFASDGRAYTLGADRLPGGRGMGEPLRLMVDQAQEAEIVALRVYRPGARLLLASDAGDGFLLPEDDAVAQTRAGRQVLNLKAPARLLICAPAEGDHVATVGQNRKMLVFALTELPEMTRGKGVRLQKFKDGGLSDAVVFRLADGLSWPMGERRRSVSAEDLADYIAKRAGTGRMAPRGFPKDNRFDPG